MGDWANIRQRARRVVHSNFSLSAVYFAPGDTVGVPCNARMHNEMQVFGDLDREMYAQTIEDVNHVVFDALEVEPVKKGRVSFGVGKMFEIVNILPKTTDEFRRVEVTHVP